MLPSVLFVDEGGGKYKPHASEVVPQCKYQHGEKREGIPVAWKYGTRTFVIVIQHGSCWLKIYWLVKDSKDEKLYVWNLYWKRAH